MDRVIDSNGLCKCAAILLNTSQQPMFLAKSSPLAQIDTCSETSANRLMKYSQLITATYV